MKIGSVIILGKEYKYVVQAYFKEPGKFIGLCSTMPGILASGETMEKAEEQIKENIQKTVEIYKALKP